MNMWILKIITQSLVAQEDQMNYVGDSILRDMWFELVGNALRLYDHAIFRGTAAARNFSSQKGHQL